MQPRPTSGPLKISAHRFQNGKKEKLYLLGAIICCGNAKEKGWPLIDEANLDLFAEHGANYTHIRLGPNSAGPLSPDADHTGYARVETPAGTRLDLNEWDESYWERVRNCVEAARVRGIYVEVSLIDVWCLKHWTEVCAWHKDANIQKFNLGSTAIVNVKPHPRAKAWVEKVVDELGAFDNVLWLDGNEVFDAHSPDATNWVTGIHDIVRARETEKGFRHHVFGTNSQQRKLRFLSNTYEVFHTKVAMHSLGRPLLINEYGSISPAEYLKQALSALHQESSMMAWRGGQTNTEWAQTLQHMLEIRQKVGY